MDLEQRKYLKLLKERLANAETLGYFDANATKTVEVADDRLLDSE